MLLAVILVRSSVRKLDAYGRATPEGTRNNPVLAEAGYLRYCAREALMNPRLVRNVVWGLWTPLAAGFAFLVLYAAWDFAKAGLSAVVQN